MKRGLHLVMKPPAFCIQCSLSAGLSMNKVDETRFILRSESPVDVPNYSLATLGDEIEATAGEGTRTLVSAPITHFADATPQLRKIENRIVRYEREADLLRLSLAFTQWLPRASLFSRSTGSGRTANFPK